MLEREGGNITINGMPLPVLSKAHSQWRKFLCQLHYWTEEEARVKQNKSNETKNESTGASGTREEPQICHSQEEENEGYN
eukprot:8335292-Ditylum_brightwellii.AAC.1